MPEENFITDPSDIQLTEQDQVQTILGKPPGWILKWGISFIFMTVLMLIWMSYLVKFPDIIQARVILTTEIPPVHLFVQSGGKIENLLVEDKQVIVENDLLVIIQNPANHRDIVILENFLEKVKVRKTVDLSDVAYPENLELGEIQSSYSDFTQNLNDFNFFENKNELVKKIEALKSQIRYLGGKNASIKKQEITMGRAIDLAKSNRDRMIKLLADKAVSIKDVEDAKSEVLRNERELERMQTDYLDNKMKAKNLELTIIDLNENRSDGKNEKSISLKEQIDVLLSEIENWKQKYLIFSPMDGQVSFPKVISKNQFLKNGDEIMTIVPQGGVGEMMGKAYLPAANNGKVDEGFEINIRLDGYPYQEFGVVKATVESKSILPQNGNYLIELKMPDSLITTYGKSIPFLQEMGGTGNIITKDRRILERIFDKFLNLTKNR
ncbi:HlyD family secretion protein [Saprospiraceae bacterium]|jgi:multidrug efflux pump subunit AcrA (membrane-fusion protein)|nr:HlyD family secretion protein [Saprospiraceae bacterium]MDB4768639.1 HlyD family secretion protein [Saprospiraceae bacterium]MDG1433053.1 HlyD family efflux transporter periplasmic adaptor subunit [Saprospiraceae bacterium]